MVFDGASTPSEMDVTQAGTLAREVFVDIASKWMLLVINVIGARTVRFGVLLNEIDGISQKMLTQSLRSLQRNGIVERTAYPTIPPRVEYRLTPAGVKLRDIVNNICVWTYEHLDEIEEARRSHPAP
ncbi:transcriptional regulator [Nocardia sp. CS682]|nr:transcriptional regulator [Nocardia sp. CS682]